jgi:hypothetical protein
MIPRDFYAKIHEAMPIACIDLVIPRCAVSLKRY